MDTIRRDTYEEPRIGVPPDEAIGKQLIGLAFGLRVCSVDGHAVRNLVDLDFLFGGNPARYAYIPLDEVWIDAGLQTDDIAGTIVHELVEYPMMRWAGLTYTEAHRIANDYECLIREYESTVGEQAIQLAQHIIVNRRPESRAPLDA